MKIDIFTKVVFLFPAALNGLSGYLFLFLFAFFTIQRAVAGLDAGDPKWIQKHGHKGILTTDFESRMESMTTSKASHVTPMGPGVRLRGRCLLPVFDPSGSGADSGLVPQ